MYKNLSPLCPSIVATVPCQMQPLCHAIKRYHCAHQLLSPLCPSIVVTTVPINCCHHCAHQLLSPLCPSIVVTIVPMNCCRHCAHQLLSPLCPSIVLATVHINCTRHCALLNSATVPCKTPPPHFSPALTFLGSANLLPPSLDVFSRPR